MTPGTRGRDPKGPLLPPLAGATVPADPVLPQAVPTGATTALVPPPPGLFAAPVAETQLSYGARAQFGDEIEQALRGLGGGGDTFALILVDLDGFQTAGGTWEEMTSDLVDSVGVRLHQSRRVGEKVFLLREHEFAVLAEKAGVAYAGSVVDRARDLLQIPFDTDRGGAYIHANFGVAVGHDTKEAVVSLLRRADEARISGGIFDESDRKRESAAEPSATIVQLPVQDLCETGRHDEVLPHPSDEVEAAPKPFGHGTDLIVDAIFTGRFCMVDLVPDLGALERGEMSLVYRPIYDLVSGAVVSLQTVARWHPATGGVGRPIDVSGSTDMNGSTRSIGKWLVKTACLEVAELQQLTMRDDLSVRIPIFARQLDNTDILDDVALALIESKLEPERLILEVSESAAMGGNSTARAIIDGLKALGVRLSIADFGSGYTSAEYLQFLEVDEITVRCPFLPDPPSTWDESGSVLYPLVKLTHAIALRIVVEGVDTFSQLTQVRDAGVRFAQGDLLSPAMDSDRLRDDMTAAPQFSRAVRTAASL